MVKHDWSRFAKIGDSFFIRIPARVVNEKTFPFKEGEQVVVEISGKELNVKKE